jgi:hypothetical protein
MRAIFAHVMAALVVTSVAAAEPRSHHRDTSSDGGSMADDSKLGHADADDGADDQDDEPGQPPLQATRTPEQTAIRQAIVDKRMKSIGDIVHAGGRPITQGERQAIGLHWRHVMRLLRIRELADADGDKAILARVDAVLARESTKFDAKLTHLHNEPAGAGEPTEHGKGGMK